MREKKSQKRFFDRELNLCCIDEIRKSSTSLKHLRVKPPFFWPFYFSIREASASARPRGRRPDGDGWRRSRSAVLQTRRSSITLQDQNAEFTHWLSEGGTSRDFSQTHSAQCQARALFALQLNSGAFLLLLLLLFLQQIARYSIIFANVTHTSIYG